MSAVLRFDLLCYSVEVTVDDPAVADTLKYMCNLAQQEGVPKAVLRYEVRTGADYEVLQDGDPIAAVATVDDVLFTIYRLSHQRVSQRLTIEGWQPVHAGVGTVAGRRFLLAGARGTGKTTLMTRLLFDGQAVEGDELTFIRDGDAMTFPRAFHVKSGTEQWVPELASIMPLLPTTSTSDGRLVYALDPAGCGFQWRVRRGAVAAVFILAAERASVPAVRRLTTLEAAHRVLEHSLPSGAPSAARVRECAQLCADVTAFELTTGPLAATARLLVEMLAATDSTSDYHARSATIPGGAP